MFSVSKTILIGRMGRDPEVRVFPSGDRVATFSVATSERWKDKQSGEWKELTEWHRVVVRGPSADYAERNLRKGDSVYIEGVIRTRKWQDQGGNDKSSTEIHANEVKTHAKAKAKDASTPEIQGGSEAPEGSHGSFEGADNFQW
ncbi:single-stranded DNA-binding protein [Simplicispira suum]|uniref:Single-stranded DNA-binding protein n=1 Tax=Simplicispira suum TaxID=2109915 RepID=A0A2S0N5P2_9BURK|nr:single-stranded DNA-binding protein [Simplicispira suum]AVO43469.1 single-stranded DNA-binding protein [Simplicispira suum]